MDVNHCGLEKHKATCVRFELILVVMTWKEDCLTLLHEVKMKKKKVYGKRKRIKGMGENEKSRWKWGKRTKREKISEREKEEGMERKKNIFNQKQGNAIEN